MKRRVYVETTIVSYLAARRSRDILVAAHQEITEAWWQRRAPDFELFVSQSVLAEAGSGDPDAARRRLAITENLPILEITEESELLATRLIRDEILPRKAAEDALHVALATVHGMDFLLTWNCRHIANAEIRRQLSRAVLEMGYELPVICTPEELAGD